MSSEMRSLGLRGPHAVYLTRLDMCERSITATELARICDKNKADVSRAMAEFLKAGIITRIGGENFYRAKISLTEKGRAAAAKLRERTRLAVELIGGRLSEEKREVFYEALELIASNMEKISKDGLPPDSFTGELNAVSSEN